MAQSGTLYLLDGTWFLKYRTLDSGKRVHKTEKLCSENGNEHHTLCAERGEHRARKHPTKKTRFGNPVVIPPKNLNAVRHKFMEPINAQQQPQRSLTQRPAAMRIVDFWQQFYVPYCEEILNLTGRPRRTKSTMRGYKQVWNEEKTGLKTHFGDMMLHEYTSAQGIEFLDSLTGNKVKTTLLHIKSVASAMFDYAKRKQYIASNPWKDVPIPDDAIDSNETKHYTLEESENLVSALVDHVDAQLFLALCCFLGLRPSEAIAVLWEDFGKETVHIRRSCVNGVVGPLKTRKQVRTSESEETGRDLPIAGLDAVRIPLDVWREKCGNPTEGWVFRKIRKIGDDIPADLHNLINRVIKPHIKGHEKCSVCDIVPKKAKVEWKGIYSARRGFATAVIGLTNGNFAAAQELLGHASMETTVRHYKKITETAKKQGMNALQAALTPKALNAGEGQ